MLDTGSSRSTNSSAPEHKLHSFAPTGRPEQYNHFGPFEPFVDEEVVARFLDLKPRRVLELAREGFITSHPLGRSRMTWRFRISEIAADLDGSKKPVRVKMPQAVPGTKKRNRLG